MVEGLGEEATYLWHKDHDLQHSDVVILPGGFSYGDYLRAGAIARFSPIMQRGRRVREARRAGARDLQRIPDRLRGGAAAGRAAAQRESQVRVARLYRFASRPRIRCSRNRYEAGRCSDIPIAHGDGRYTADEATLDRLEGEGRVVFRYVGGPGDADEWWSPNGSMRAIAGIVNDAGNVLGMMPHPERAVDPLLGSADGLGVFESMLARVTA